MTEVIIAVDELDGCLGDFFSECLQELEIIEKDAKCGAKYIKSNQLNEVAISLTVPVDKAFIFLAYSHGSETELLKKGTIPYISEKLNIDKFKKTFFYTCSCKTGKSLGQTLVDNDCYCYIGYDEEFTVWDFNRKPFVECANIGFKYFLAGNEGGEVINLMKEKYDEAIDNYENDFFGAAHLLSNKNALILKGDPTYSISKMI